MQSRPRQEPREVLELRAGEQPPSKSSPLDGPGTELGATCAEVAGSWPLRECPREAIAYCEPHGPPFLPTLQPSRGRRRGKSLLRRPDNFSPSTGRRIHPPGRTDRRWGSGQLIADYRIFLDDPTVGRPKRECTPARPGDRPRKSIQKKEFVPFANATTPESPPRKPSRTNRRAPSWQTSAHP